MDLGKKGGSNWLRRLQAWLRRQQALLANMRREPAVPWLIPPFGLLVVAATVVAIGLGFVLARQADDDLTAKDRRALVQAMEALQAVAPDLSNIEPRLIRVLEHASGAMAASPGG